MRCAWPARTTDPPLDAGEGGAILHNVYRYTKFQDPKGIGIWARSELSSEPYIVLLGEGEPQRKRSAPLSFIFQIIFLLTFVAGDDYIIPKQ